jgi:soluble lytic murein transglycosylase-like protein
MLVIYVSAATATPADLMHCIVRHESDYQVEAVSSAGAIGVAQFMPTTHAWLAKLAGMDARLGNPVEDLLLLSWAIEHGYGPHWATWQMCQEGEGP